MKFATKQSKLEQNRLFSLIGNRLDIVLIAHSGKVSVTLPCL